MQRDKELVTVLSDLIDRGYRFLESRGWYRYNDSIAPPDPYRHGYASTDAEDGFRKALTALENLIPF